MMHRRNFLKTFAGLSGFFAITKVISHTDENSPDKSRVHEFQIQKISDTTITWDQKKLVRNLNHEYFQSGKLISVSTVKNAKTSETETDAKHVYVFESAEAKMQYLFDKANILQPHKKSLT